MLCLDSFVALCFYEIINKGSSKLFGFCSNNFHSVVVRCYIAIIVHDPSHLDISLSKNQVWPFKEKKRRIRCEGGYYI